MSVIEYTALCSICREDGKSNRLGLESLTSLEVSCKEGHKFGSLEEAESFSALQGDDAASLDEDFELPSPSLPIARMDALPPDLPGPPIEAEPTDPEFYSEPPPTEPPPPPPTEITVEDTSPRLPDPKANDLVTASKKALAKPLSGPTSREEFVFGAKPKDGKMPPMVRLPGGDLLLTVRIPEAAASALAAECEVQKISIGDRMLERIVWGLEAGWFL